MKQVTKMIGLLLLSLSVSAEDLSGVYQCLGDDAHEGKYTGTVTLRIRPEHSKAPYASYDFQLAVPNYGVYQGHAVVQGMYAAMHFALPNENGMYGGKIQDYGTGLAEFKRNKQGKLGFKKFYYEPKFKGGNTGLEQCIKDVTNN